FEAAGTRHGHGEDLRLQPGATTGRAGHLPHIALVALLLRLRLGLVEAPLEERHDALEPRIVRADPPESVAVAHPDLGGRSAEDRLADLGGQILPRGPQVELHVGGEAAEQLLEVVRALPT